uniref:Transmembrane protein 231 n=1 Tax=Plectus sambesii TaxID=2011161 RepID=A0A914XB41_9BILA
MTLSHVYARPLKENFRAGLCSGAFIFQLISILITIIAPLLIAYQSQGFWLKTSVYREQPLVGFKYRYLFLLRTDQHDSYFLWSSFTGLNSLESSHLRIPLIDSSEIDLNRDGKPDQLALKVGFPLNPDDAIHSVIWMLVFDYELQSHSRFQMQTLIN